MAPPILGWQGLCRLLRDEGLALPVAGTRKEQNMDFEKFTERARGFVQAAQTIAMREYNQQITPEHLLKAFLDDEDAYCQKFGLGEAQRAAVRSRDVLAMIEAGGNVYYLAKLAGIFGLNVQDIGAQQTGTTVDEFKAKLAAAGR